ncbi:MAG: hypothetical protein QXG75_03805, partial [Candidatus Caldarchaeum sp.]
PARFINLFLDRLRFFTAFSHGGVVVHRLPNTPRQPLNIPECEVTAGWRLRIPNMYKPLFYYEANDGREVRIAVWFEDVVPFFSYREDEESCLFLQATSQTMIRENRIVVGVVKRLYTGINVPIATEY